VSSSGVVGKASTCRRQARGTEKAFDTRAAHTILESGDGQPLGAGSSALKTPRTPLCCDHQVLCNFAGRLPALDVLHRRSRPTSGSATLSPVDRRFLGVNLQRNLTESVEHGGHLMISGDGLVDERPAKDPVTGP
jgi:hypothetical protein